MKRLFAFLTILLCLSTLAAAQPTVTAVLHAASYEPVLSPGSFAAIFGTNLSTTTGGATALPLPANLNGVSVKFGDVPGFMSYVSPTQINTLIPLNLTIPSGGRVAVTVTTSDGTSTAYNVRITPTAPALFTRDASGGGSAHAFLYPDWSPVAASKPGDVVILYASGLGQTDPPGGIEMGGAASEPLNRVSLDTFELYLGDRLIPKENILFAGLAPQLAGVYQLNVLVPPGAMTNRLYIKTGSMCSRMTEIGIQPGGNVANVTASIEGLWPPTKPNQPPFNLPVPGLVSYSPLSIAASYKVSFDILPNAQPFTVMAVGDAGSSKVTIDPSAATYQFEATEPIQRARYGDFSGTEIQVADFLQNGGPMPNNIVPMSRLDPGVVSALQLLPLPNTPVGGSSTGLLKNADTLTSGSHIEFDNRFGGFLVISWGPIAKRTAVFKVFVDGVLAASSQADYDIAHQ